MKVKTSICVLLAGGVLSARALDLTPENAFRELEGIKIPIVNFHDGAKKISIQPPVKWSVTGGGTSVSLYPSTVTDAVMQLRVRGRKPVEPGATEDLEQWCRNQLPGDAANPILNGETTNVFTLGTLSSREFTYTYGAQGRRFVTSVAVVDWSERERFAVVVVARAADFPAVHEAAIRTMFSWNME
jgi:hypothetical protein